MLKINGIYGIVSELSMLKEMFVKVHFFVFSDH